MTTLAQDIRYAVRVLATNRAVTLAAAFSLALGIGANTAIFAFVQVGSVRPTWSPSASRRSFCWW